MENNENKTSAELAREERKERIEKASQARTEKRLKQASQSAAKRKAKKIVPIAVLALALILLLTYFFGVPHRVFSAVKLADGTKISVAEYEYYYMALYNNTVNTAYEYEQYYSAYYGEGAGLLMTGFDYSKTPENQKYTNTDQYEFDEKYGDSPTWADYLEQSAVETCQAFSIFYNEAMEAGFEMSDEGKEEVSSYIEELRTYAADSDFSLDAYLRETYGRGMTESLFKEILTKQIVVSEFLTEKQEEFGEDVTMDEILEAYNENPNEYNKVSFRCFTLESELAANTDDTNYTDEELTDLTEKSKNETIALMDKFCNEATADNFTALTEQYAPEDKKSQYKDTDTNSKLEGAVYSEIANYFSEDVAKWVYEDGRQIGDKKAFTLENDDGTVYCDTILITSLPSRDDTKQPVAVRHILFALEESKTVTSDNGATTTEKVALRTLAEAKKLAEDTLDAWVKGGAKEDAFIDLAAELSEDPGSSENGGLYDDVTKSSNYVEPFLNWCFAEGRKVGDYGIIETEYGYHIMYMSAISETTEWQSSLKDSLTTEKFNAYYDGLFESEDYAASLSNFFGGRVRNRLENYATNLILQMNASASATTTTTSPSSSEEK